MCGLCDEWCVYVGGGFVVVYYFEFECEMFEGDVFFFVECVGYVYVFDEFWMFDVVCVCGEYWYDCVFYDV